MIRIGVNPIGWSNDDMREIGGDISLETCLAEARDAGFSGLELGHKFPRDASVLKPVLEEYGHDLVSGWYSTELLTRDVDAEIKAARPHIDLLKAMGCSLLIAAETSNAMHTDRSRPLSTKPVLASDAWPDFADRMTAFAERLRDEGLQLVYHHHMGTIVEREQEIDRFMGLTGEAVHLLLDTGHATWGGADPARLACNYRARIGHVHCKDIRADVMRAANADDLSFLDSVLAGVYTVPGDGLIDFVRVFRALENYAGWIVVEAEQDPRKAEPAHYARLGHDNVKRFLKQAGL